MGTEVNLSGLSSSTNSSIDGLKADVNSTIRDLESYLSSVTVYSDMPSSFLADVTKISFDGIDRAIDIIGDISYDLVETRELMPDSEDMEVTHTFNSPELDAIEGQLLSLISTAGTDNIKNISSCFLSDSDISTIESSYEKQRNIELNFKTSALDMYPTPDTVANTEWIRLRNSYSLKDFKKELYANLFELAQKTSDWVGKQAIHVEEIHADFTSSYNSLLNGLVDANIAAYHAEVKANIANLKNEITKRDAIVDINSMKAKQKTSETQLLVEQESARLTEYTRHYAGAMKNSLASLDTNIGISKAVSGSYKSMLSAHAQRYSGVVLGRQTSGD